MAREDAERERIDEDCRRVQNWRRWGPYLADRQWGTVREDYSATGECWSYFPHDHARSRVYRWGEDGLLGICDRECRICFTPAIWNGKDPILKERLFGLTGPEGNHGEDCKELYYHLDATPTSSYLKALYKYPQTEFPYAQLVHEGASRGKLDPEFEIEYTGAFDRGYWDMQVEYAKASPDDMLIRITVTNRGPAQATAHLLPQVWLRNTWSWGRHGEGYDAKGSIDRVGATSARVEQPTLGHFRFEAEGDARLLFTDNETNCELLYNSASASKHTKDAFHRRVIQGDEHAVNAAGTGTKCAAWYELDIAPGESKQVRLRLTMESQHKGPPFADFDEIMSNRIDEADEYHRCMRNTAMTDEERLVVRQADAGLVWTRKFYHYIVEHWLEGDPAQPFPPDGRKLGRNHTWTNLWCRDVISMPDGWEYPWFAAWDLAFHCVAMARFDPDFAKHQMLLLTREWYMHPNGQLPAYEFAFGDVNPPVHAWAIWRVYQLAADAGHGHDRVFLERAFDKCLINFTWWVNREDAAGDNLFSGGFLGLDNVGVFDRSQPLPGGGELIQADATAWMAFYCTTMISMALELAKEEPPYADLALKFFEHFVAIARRDEHARRHRPVGRRRGLLLRPDALRRGRAQAEDPLDGRPGAAVRGDVARRRSDDEVAGVHEAAQLVHEQPPRDRAHDLEPVRRRSPAPTPRDPESRAARARAALHARRRRVPVAARHSLAIARAPAAPVRAVARRPELRGPLHARRVRQRHLRRELELARAGVVPDELSDRRGARSGTTTSTAIRSSSSARRVPATR